MMVYLMVEECSIPEITDEPPEEIKKELAELCVKLDMDVPAKIPDRNLLIATWNLRGFGDLTESWECQKDDVSKRDLHALRCITEIVSRFDVIAIQEVRSNLKCLRHMLKKLGPDWGLILTDVTKGKSGNYERLAFVFDTRKVRISGLACELVVPEEQLNKIGPDALKKQFARTPYAVSFRSAGKTFILVTLHVIYGINAEERVPELKAIAEWLAEWAKEIKDWKQNLIALGDFNIVREGDKLYNAFISTGLYIPKVLHNFPRTIFSDPKKPAEDKFYDQIAWFTGKDNTPVLSLNFVQGGIFDFTKIALKSLNLTKEQLSYRISDHYPLWAEFQVRD
jgi:endonuclease/exonuclease/phosphatase family metal-dependent hydrolase